MLRGKKFAERKTEKRSALAEKLDRVFAKTRLVKAGERVGVAVSGGADSVALLRILLELRKKWGLVLSVLHFNHKLRGKSSDKDEQFVENLAKQHGLDFFSEREDIAARTHRERGNLEAVARQARYGFFERVQKQGHVSKVATAHTADDQAETVLAHILRGTGLSGLRGIHPRTGSVFRPLLNVRRQELRRYLKTLRQSWREDSTNRDTKRMRARIRLKLLPMLEKNFNTGVVEHLCNLAELAGEDEDFLEMRATEWIANSTSKINHEVSVRLVLLLHAPRALQARILRQLVAGLKTRSGQLSKEHVEAVLELTSQRNSGKTLQLPGGIEVRRETELLRFGAIFKKNETLENTSRRGFAHEIDLRGGRAELRLVELSCLLHFREIDWPAERRETSDTGVALDRSRLHGTLIVRNWLPGDAMRPKGHQKVHTLARLLNEKSVSRWEKEKWPVLTCGGKVAWARGLAPSIEFAAGADTRRVLVIVEEPLT